MSGRDTVLPCNHHIYCRAATLTFCTAAISSRGGLWEEVLQAAPIWGGLWRAVNLKETAMKLFSLPRFLRARRTYWSVVQELSRYTDRELHDIGIDRADIHAIARMASQEPQ